MKGEEHERLGATALLLKQDRVAAGHFERAADAYWLEGNTKRAGVCVRLWSALGELGNAPTSPYRGREVSTMPPPKAPPHILTGKPVSFRCVYEVESGVLCGGVVRELVEHPSTSLCVSCGETYHHLPRRDGPGV